MSKYDTLTSLLIASEFALPNKVVDSFTVCYTYYYWTLETGKLSYQLLSFLFRFFLSNKSLLIRTAGCLFDKINIEVYKFHFNSVSFWSNKEPAISVQMYITYTVYQ